MAAQRMRVLVTLYKGMCGRCRATYPCLICTDWSGIERRAPLPVRDQLRRAPWRLQA
jgi:hypothetical protein